MGRPERETPPVLPVFVYGTLRRGSWNHDEWLAPWLADLPQSRVLAGYALHAYAGLPYVVADPGRSVAGELAQLDPRVYDEALERLDTLEDVRGRHYDRTEVVIGDDRALLYVAGPIVAAELGDDTVVDSGDWTTWAGP